MQTKQVALLVAASMCVGVAIGIVIQRGYGVGRILRSAGLIDTGVESAPRTAVSERDEIPSEWQGRLSLFALAGQSNMSGSAPVPERSPARNPLVFTFGNDYRWHVAQEPVDSPVGQVDRVSRDPFAGFGPSLAFATHLLERRPDRAIGLIPCAKSSSFIEEWRHDLSETSLYGSCLKRMLAASTMGKVEGFLFFQGESDALSQPHRGRVPHPDEWAARFADMVESMRSDLGLPDLPVVFGQIGPAPAEGFENWEVVQRQQASIQLPSTVMIKTDDLTLHDELHFSVESYRTIGRRLADAYLEVTSDDR